MDTSNHFLADTADVLDLANRFPPYDINSMTIKYLGFHSYTDDEFQEPHPYNNVPIDHFCADVGDIQTAANLRTP